MTVVEFLNAHHARANPASLEVYVSDSLARDMLFWGATSPERARALADLHFYVVKCNKGWVIVSRD